MKRLFALLLAVLLSSCLAFATPGSSGSGSSGSSESSSVPDVDELMESEGIAEVTDAIPPSVREQLPQADNIRGTVESMQPQTFVQQLAATVRGYMGAPLRLLVSLCGVMLLGAMFEIFHTTLNGGSSRSFLQVVIAVALASLIVTPVVQCITDAAVTLRDFSYFILTYIPVFSGVLTAAGQPLTAAAYNIFLFWICQMTSQMIAAWFTPLLCAYLALSVMAVVCPSLGLGRLVGGIKTFVVWGLTLTLTVFVGLLSIQAVVASNGDQLAVKTTKFMIGSLIPGVGGALSDLFVAAQGCIQLAKGTLGAFGVVVTLLTFLPMLVRVVLWYLALNLSSLVGSILGLTDIAGLLKNIAATMGLLLAVLLYDLLLVVISTTIIIVSFAAH